MKSNKMGVNNMEQIIKTITSNVLGVTMDEVMIESRLMGGMSNYMFVVKVKEEKYTFRIPGDRSETFVNRDEELENINRVKPLGINNETIYFDALTGWKMARYVEGTPLSEMEDPTVYLQSVANVLKSLHQSGLQAAADYNPYQRLAKYEAEVMALGFTHDAQYHALKAEFLSYQPKLDAVEKVFCHNDSQISNIVITSEKTFLLDWEFGGNNDPLYDVACVGNKDFELALAFLPVYLGREATKDEYQRLYVWRAFQCLQWHNVAMFKELIGLSEKLGVNFDAVGKMYLTKAEQFLTAAKTYSN